jgi:hypothetical protein
VLAALICVTVTGIVTRLVKRLPQDQQHSGSRAARETNTRLTQVYNQRHCTTIDGIRTVTQVRDAGEPRKDVARITVIIRTTRTWRNERTRNTFDSIYGDQRGTPIERIGNIKTCCELITTLDTVNRTGRKSNLNQTDITVGCEQSWRNNFSAGVNKSRAGRRSNIFADSNDTAISNNYRRVFDGALRADRMHSCADDCCGLSVCGASKYYCKQYKN